MIILSSKALLQNCIAQATLEAKLSASIFYRKINIKSCTHVSENYSRFSLSNIYAKTFNFIILDKNLLTHKFY